MVLDNSETSGLQQPANVAVTITHDPSPQEGSSPDTEHRQQMAKYLVGACSASTRRALTMVCGEFGGASRVSESMGITSINELYELVTSFIRKAHLVLAMQSYVQHGVLEINEKEIESAVRNYVVSGMQRADKKRP